MQQQCRHHSAGSHQGCTCRQALRQTRYVLYRSPLPAGPEQRVMHAPRRPLPREFYRSTAPGRVTRSHQNRPEARASASHSPTKKNLPTQSSEKEIWRGAPDASQSACHSLRVQPCRACSERARTRQPLQRQPLRRPAQRLGSVRCKSEVGSSSERITHRFAARPRVANSPQQIPEAH